jgi:cell wall-associated NlpC family hydrolase
MKKETALFSAGALLGFFALMGAGAPDDPPQPASPPPKPAAPQKRTTAAAFLAQLARYLGRGLSWSYGGSGPWSYDCSGLLWRSANDLGIKIPRVASGMLKVARAAGPALSYALARATPGVFVFFFRRKDGALRHVEISTGDGYTIASQIKGGPGRYRFGWWLSKKQREKWRVEFYKYPNFTQ